MKTKEIRSTEKAALEEKKLELKKELIKLEAQVAVGSAVKSPGQIKKIKKSIARILTVEKEKQMKKEAKKAAPQVAAKKQEAVQKA